MAAAAGAGAEGIEVFPDAMMPEWPYISDSFVDKWNGLLERYGLEPVCVDHFSDRAMWHDKLLTDDEMYERSVLYIKTAHKLSCHAIRLLHNEHIGLEISPYKLTDAAIAERLGLSYLGLQADFSSYEYCISTADIIEATQLGLRPEILNYVRDAQRDAYFSGRVFNFDDIADKLEALNPTKEEKQFIKRHGA